MRRSITRPTESDKRQPQRRWIHKWGGPSLGLRRLTRQPPRRWIPALENINVKGTSAECVFQLLILVALNDWGRELVPLSQKTILIYYSRKVEYMRIFLRLSPSSFKYFFPPAVPLSPPWPTERDKLGSNLFCNLSLILGWREVKNLTHFLSDSFNLFIESYFEF